MNRKKQIEDRWEGINCEILSLECDFGEHKYKDGHLKIITAFA